MAETLYGPWRVVLGTFDLFPQQGFSIAGSHNADARYEATDGVPIDLQVQGVAWTITLEFHPPFGGEGWQPSVMRRHTRFDHADGLIVTVDSYRHQSGGWSGPYYPGIQVVCTSMDPAVHPDAMPNPYDFTIPEHD